MGKSGNTSNNTLNNLTAGNYRVTISDNNNCSVVHTFTINNTALLLLTLIQLTLLVSGLSNGKAYATVSLPYVTYLWSTGGTTDTIKNLIVGTYRLTVTDPVSGCISAYSIIVNEPAQINGGFVIVNESCSPRMMDLLLLIL